MSLLINLLQGALGLTILSFGFTYVVMFILDKFDKSVNAGKKRLFLAVTFVAYLGMGAFLLRANSQFQVARSGLDVNKSNYTEYLSIDFERQINSILQNQIWLIASIYFFLFSLSLVWLFRVGLNTGFDEAKKLISIFLVATLAFAFYGLNRSENQLRSQAVDFSIDQTYVLCSFAQNTLNDRESSLNSSDSYRDMYESINFGQNELEMLSYQIERQSEYLSETAVWGHYSEILSESILKHSNEASDALLSTILEDLDASSNPASIYGLMMDADYGCEDWDIS